MQARTSRESKAMARFRREAFTLIEVLMVVIIMAVLAATIIPQFSTSAKDAKLSVLKYNLRCVRSQLESYKVQHLGVYPPATAGADFARQLTQKTDPNMAFDPAHGACGPYLAGEIPVNPFNQSAGVAILQGDSEPAGPTGSADGWQYNPRHGWFYPNNSEYFQSSGSFANPN
jgi:prepilin-type N-terminal cleavage/methylation domain-containing protein